MNSRDTRKKKSGRAESSPASGEQPVWHRETALLHQSWHPYEGGREVVPGWVSSTVFRHSPGGLPDEQWYYSRLGNPNRSQLETALAVLDGGGQAFAFSSGMAAVQAVFHLLEPGDHILLPEDLYHGVRSLIENHYARWGLKYDYVDMTRPGKILDAARPGTRMIWMESPSNPMLRITDLASVARLARENGWISVADNTWATALLQQPLALGVDMVLYSTTKYMGGHSDLLGGALVLPEDKTGAPGHRGLAEKLRGYQVQAGAVPSSFDCWLLLRSLKTLAVRIRAQSESAEQLAGRLLNHPGVARVYYPGLESHPGRSVAARQMNRAGAMISFEIYGDAAAALRMVSSARLIVPATSLGGVESTWEHRKSSELRHSKTPDNLVRLSVGLETVEDLWRDIEQSLASISQKK